MSITRKGVSWDEPARPIPLAEFNKFILGGTMSESATTSAADLLKELEADAKEKTEQAEAQLEQTLAAPAETKDQPEKQVFVKMYKVLVDNITAESHDPTKQNVSVLNGRVTDFDLASAGVDKEWLLRSGSIEEDGYEPV